MANGKPFDPDRLTAASWFYDLGTKVVVTHEGRSVVVEITDRGPAKHFVRQGRKIDLSRAAFSRLGNPKTGLIEVTIKKPVQITSALPWANPAGQSTQLARAGR